nr:hypothetical protein [Candidatus Anoxychlamydiales bacterium]
YSIIVILGGIMSFRWADSTISLYMEILLGTFLFINSIFLMKENLYLFLIAFVVTTILAIFYSYNFSKTHSFFQILLAMISFFMIGYNLLKISRFKTK